MQPSFHIHALTLCSPLTFCMSNQCTHRIRPAVFRGGAERLCNVHTGGKGEKWAKPTDRSEDVTACYLVSSHESEVDQQVLEGVLMKGLPEHAGVRRFAVTGTTSFRGACYKYATHLDLTCEVLLIGTGLRLGPMIRLPLEASTMLWLRWGRRHQVGLRAVRHSIAV